MRLDRADRLRLVEAHARWRHQPATAKQLQHIREARLVVPEGITRGQASHLLAMLWKGRTATRHRTSAPSPASG